MTNLILDPLNVFFLDILVLKKDTDVTHLLFGIISLVLMSHLMNLSPISLLRLLVTVLLLIFLSYHPCLLLNLLRNHSRYIVAGRNLQQRPLPRLVIQLLILPLFQLLCANVSVLVPLTLSLSLSFMVTCLHFLSALFENATWSLVTCPPGKNYCWLSLGVYCEVFA